MAEEKRLYISADYDAATNKWFREHPFAQTTVTQCELCGLYYKPILGHKCKKKGVSNAIQ